MYVVELVHVASCYLRSVYVVELVHVIIIIIHFIYIALFKALKVALQSPVFIQTPVIPVVQKRGCPISAYGPSDHQQHSFNIHTLHVFMM